RALTDDLKLLLLTQVNLLLGFDLSDLREARFVRNGLTAFTVDLRGLLRGDVRDDGRALRVTDVHQFHGLHGAHAPGFEIAVHFAGELFAELGAFAEDFVHVVAGQNGTRGAAHDLLQLGDELFLRAAGAASRKLRVHDNEE